MRFDGFISRMWMYEVISLHCSQLTVFFQRTLISNCSLALIGLANGSDEVLLTSRHLPWERLVFSSWALQWRPRTNPTRRACAWPNGNRWRLIINSSKNDAHQQNWPRTSAYSIHQRFMDYHSRVSKTKSLHQQELVAGWKLLKAKQPWLVEISMARQITIIASEVLVKKCKEALSEGKQLQNRFQPDFSNATLFISLLWAAACLIFQKRCPYLQRNCQAEKYPVDHWANSPSNHQRSGAASAPSTGAKPGNPNNQGKISFRNLQCSTLEHQPKPKWPLRSVEYIITKYNKSNNPPWA